MTSFSNWLSSVPVLRTSQQLVLSGTEKTFSSSSQKMTSVAGFFPLDQKSSHTSNGSSAWSPKHGLHMQGQNSLSWQPLEQRLLSFAPVPPASDFGKERPFTPCTNSITCHENFGGCGDLYLAKEEGHRWSKIVLAEDFWGQSLLLRIQALLPFLTHLLSLECKH